MAHERYWRHKYARCCLFDQKNGGWKIMSHPIPQHGDQLPYDEIDSDNVDQIGDLERIELSTEEINSAEDRYQTMKMVEDLRTIAQY